MFVATCHLRMREPVESLCHNVESLLHAYGYEYICSIAMACGDCWEFANFFETDYLL
jgi:hypothetical protein